MSERDEEETTALLEALVEHNADRWRAEEENARRLGTRRGQLQAIISVLLVLGVSGVAKGFQDIPACLAPIWRWLLFGSAALFFFFLIWALKRLLRIEREREPDGETRIESGDLAWPFELAPDAEDEWPTVRLEQALKARFLILEDAAGGLYEANIRAAEAAKGAQVRLFFAVCALFGVFAALLIARW